TCGNRVLGLIFLRDRIFIAMKETVKSHGGVLHSRRIFTMQPGLHGDTLWWQDGCIRGVGYRDKIERAAPPHLARFELPEALVSPGLTDGHTHLAMWALNRRRLDLSACRSREAVLARVAAAQPVQGWVIGQGWNANGWSVPPDRLALDRVQANPVYLDSLDVHTAWLNTPALAAVGITRSTPDPFGGRIARDGNGEPTGLLFERAVELATPHLPQPPIQVLDAALREAQAEAHRLGITGIHEVETMETLAAFERLQASGDLRLRVLFHPPVTALQRLVDRGVRSGQGSEWLTIGGVKIFLDGSLGSRTAWMLEPYTGSHDRGLPITGEREARAAMTAAASAGISTTVHAIGDAAVRRALDLVSALSRAAIPHRIEHFQCVHPRDLERAGVGGIVLSMQPAHLLTDIDLVERYWGERGSGAYAFRSLLARGARLVFGSDVPVASLDPRVGIHAALERKGFDGAPAHGWRPEEKLDFGQALHGYTVAAADAAGAGHRRGRLVAGMDADFVAWEVPPEAERGDGEAFRQGRALLTVVGGEVVMRQ
ncbi:MAG TPA: amidohydrolase, partial [Gemmatimonadales bacterium]|nr:amidohydrolase [Gemmatimonadales bacterium]